jgi:hypothetical protein
VVLHVALAFALAAHTVATAKLALARRAEHTHPELGILREINLSVLKTHLVSAKNKKLEPALIRKT